MTTTPHPASDQPADQTPSNDPDSPNPNPESDPLQDGITEPARCANCGGEISQDDLECPHCGISLAAG